MIQEFTLVVLLFAIVTVGLVLERVYARFLECSLATSPTSAAATETSPIDKLHAFRWTVRSGTALAVFAVIFALKFVSIWCMVLAVLAQPIFSAAGWVSAWSGSPAPDNSMGRPVRMMRWLWIVPLSVVFVGASSSLLALIVFYCSFINYILALGWRVIETPHPAIAGAICFSVATGLETIIEAADKHGETFMESVVARSLESPTPGRLFYGTFVCGFTGVLLASILHSGTHSDVSFALGCVVVLLKCVTISFFLALHLHRAMMRFTETNSDFQRFEHWILGMLYFNSGELAGRISHGGFSVANLGTYLGWMYLLTDAVKAFGRVLVVVFCAFQA